MLYLNEQKLLIEQNFFEYRNLFKSYSETPMKYLIAVDTPSDEKEEPGVHILRLMEKVTENTVLCCNSNQIKVDWPDELLHYEGREYKSKWTMTTGVGHFWVSNRTYLDFPVDLGLVPLRGIIYSQLEQDLEAVKNQVRKRYGA